jgi:hypothetical protein
LKQGAIGETWSSNTQTIDTSKFIAQSKQEISILTLKNVNSLRLYGEYPRDRQSATSELIIRTSTDNPISDVTPYFNQVKDIIATLNLKSGTTDPNQAPTRYVWRSNLDCGLSILEPSSDSISNPSSLDAGRVWKYTSRQSFNYLTNTNSYQLRVEYLPNSNILGTDYTSGYVSASCNDDVYSGNVQNLLNALNSNQGSIERNGTVKAVSTQR